MDKTKLFKYSTWGLLALNLSILAFFLLTKPGHPPHLHEGGNFRLKVTEILSLNEKQESQFFNLAREHKKQMDDLNNKQSGLLRTYFSSLSDLSIKDDSNEGLEPLQQLQNDKLKTTYAHLLSIKLLLNKDQLPQFDSFMNEFTDRVMVDKSNKRPPPPRR